MLRMELAHHHHALPVGDGHQQRSAAFSRNLRNACAVWFFLLGGKSLARSMKQFLSSMALSTRSIWRFKPPPCVGRLHRKMRDSVLNPRRDAGSVDGGKILVDSSGA